MNQPVEHLRVDQDPNTRRWADAAEHVSAYLSSNGGVGHTWHDRPHLLLTTTGRRSGREHTVPLVYGRLPWNGSLVVVASAGGAEKHPAWYLNLCDQPRVGVQVWDRRWQCTAITATAQDEEAAWQVMIATWAGFGAYRDRTQRRIPVVLLTAPD